MLNLDIVKVYLKFKGTIDIGVWCSENITFDLLGYTYADFTGCLTERKSSRGTFYFLKNCLVSRISKNKILSPSLFEEEYVADGSYCAQLLWMN